MPTRCFLQIRGRWYALMNRLARQGHTDAVVLRPMAPHDVAAYQSMKQSGFVDAAIFAQLYPPQPEAAPIHDVVVPAALLTKTQLSYLIENKIGTAMPSLRKMCKDDLICLLGRL